MARLMWKRHVVAKPVQLVAGERAMVEARLAEVLAHADARIEAYWMEEA